MKTGFSLLVPVSLGYQVHDLPELNYIFPGSVFPWFTIFCFVTQQCFSGHSAASASKPFAAQVNLRRKKPQWSIKKAREKDQNINAQFSTSTSNSPAASHITQYEELGFSKVTQMRDDYTTNFHNLT